MFLKKGKLKLILGFFIFLVLFFPSFSYSSEIDSRYDRIISDSGEEVSPLVSVITPTTGLTSKSIPAIVGSIIQMILGLFAIIGVCVIVYAGIIWMTSAGDATKIQKAKKLMINTLIGMLIIFSSYALTSFFIGKMTGIFGSGSGSSYDGGEDDPYDPGNLNGSSSFRVESMIPFDSSLNVKTCARVASLFNADVLDSSIYHNDDSDYSFIVKNSVTGDDFVNLDLESDFTQIKERSFSYYHNDNNFATNTTYLVNLTEDIKDTSGRSLTPKTWSFTTEVEESELEYPVIYRSFPLNNSRDVCRNSNMQFQFSYDLEGDDLAQMDYITYNTDNIWLLECETSSEDGENCLSWSDEKVPITVTAKSDSTGFTITANSAMSSYTWYRVIIKTAGYDGISQNNGVPASQGTVNNPNVDASDGISDICGRPLDGNKNGLADGTYFSSYDPDTDLIDDYVLEFKTNSDINCLPFISSVTPDSGLHSQDLITIEGENFGIFGEIFFNGFLADDHCYSSPDGSCEALPLDYDIHSDFILNQIGHCGDCEVSWNNNLIEYKVSENAVSGVLKVEVGNYSAESDFDVSYKMNDKEGGEIFSDIKNIFIPEVLADEYDVSYGKDVEILSPNIASLSANSGPIGQFVTIRGKNFGNEISKVWFVKISDYSVVEAYAPLSCDSLDTWSDNEIIIEVPTLELTNYRIIVGIDSEMGGYYYSNGEPFEVLEGEPGPGLCSIDPNSQFVGFPVVLDGVNFGSGKESDSIYFGKDVVDEYISTYSDVNYWSSDSIELIVPSDAYSNNVYVKVDDKFSNSLRLSVLEDFSCPDEVKDICDNVGINGIGLFSREECESQHDACLFTDGAFNTCVADPSVCINFPECSDYIDNDGDGLIDYPNDPECIMAETDSEINSGETPDDPPHPEGECGDGVYTPGVEVCDSSSSFTITETCSDYGYGTGALGCTDDCNYDYSGCSDPPTGSLICEFGTEETRINPFPVEITSGNAYGIVAADGSYTYGKSWHGYHDKDNRIAKFGLDGTEIGDLSSFDTSLAMTYYPVFTDNNETHDKGVIFNGYSTYNAYLGGTNRLQVMDLETGGVYLSDPLENLHRRNDVSSVLDTNYSQILVTSDGKYLYTLSYTRSTGYNGYTVNKYDPRDSMKLIDEYIFYGTSLYTDGVIADGNYLYAFQWSGNGTITRLNLENETIAYSWRSEQRNSSDLHTGRVDIINGQFDWKNNVIWMGDLVDHDRNDLDENAWIYKYTSCSTASYSCGDGICMPSESCPLDCGTLVDTIQIRAKAKKYDSINPILEFWYRKTTGEWEKLFEDEITNQTFFLNYKYNLETSINMTGFAIAYQNDGDPKTDRELYVDSIRFNGDSEKIEFNGTDENIIYDLGSSSNAWRDDLNTEVPAGVLDENGAFRTKITYPPQCENGIQDEDELGVDCGGPCASCPEDEDPDDPVVSGTCGNGVIDGDEWCDYSASTASNLKCSDFGYDSSDKVRCDTSCVVDLSFCPGYNPSPNETCEFLTKDTREQEVGEFKPKFSGGGETSDAVGLTATAGDYMYVKSYSAYDGDDQNLTKVRKSDGVVVENIGTLSSSISMFYHPPYTDYLGFHEDGVIYNGYVDSGRIRILDLKINQKYWSKTPNSFLMRPDDSNVTASGGNVLLTFDGKYIYNLSYKISSLYDGFKVKVYDPKNNMRLVNSWSTSYPSFEVGGIVADAGYLYAIEKGDNARVVRMNAETGAYIYQWKTENDFGYAEFDGVDDYMVIPNTSDFNFGEGGITYSSWIKTTSSQTDYIAYHNHYSDVYYYITGGRVRALIRDRYGNRRYRTSASKINDGKWHNFTFTWNGLNDQLDLYVDGIKDQSEVVSDGKSVGPIEFTRPIFIGRNSSSYFYKGSLSEFRIYDRVLSDDEIRSIAYSDDVNSISSLQNGLVAYYPFQVQTVRAIESSASENLIPGGDTNSYPTIGNGWGTYNTNQYNSNEFFNIGTVSGVEDNIAVLSSIEHPIYTYDVLRAETSGGGVEAGNDYFIKKHSANSFSLHEYNSSQDGSLGFSVHDSVNNDERVPISFENFPNMWKGRAHRPNSGLVKEIITDGFNKNGRVHDCIRLHTEHKTEGKTDDMAYGVRPILEAGKRYTFSFYYKATNTESIGSTIRLQLHTNGISWYGPTVNINSTDWEKYEVTLTSPNNGSTNMYFWMSSGATIDISEIEVYEVDSTSFKIDDLSSNDNYILNIGASVNSNTIPVLAGQYDHVDNKYWFGEYTSWSGVEENYHAAMYSYNSCSLYDSFCGNSRVDPGEDCDPSYDMYPDDVTCSDYFTDYRENETAKISCTADCKYNLAERCVSSYSISNPCVVSEDNGEVAFYFPFDSSYDVYSDWTKSDGFDFDRSWQVNNEELYFPSNGNSTLTLNYPIEDESYVISGQFRSYDDDNFGFYFNKNGSDYYRIQIANVLVSGSYWNSNYIGIRLYKNGRLVKENTNFAYDRNWYDFKLSLFADQDSDGLRIEFAISDPKAYKDEVSEEYNNYIIFDDASGLPSGDFAFYNRWNSGLRFDDIKVVYISDDAVCTPTVLFNEITVRAKSVLDYDEGADMELWYSDINSNWTKLDTFDVDNTNYQEFTYQTEDNLISSGLASVYINDSCSSCSSVEPFSDRNLYIDWIQYDDSSTRIESNDNTQLIRDFGGSSVSKWTDNISTSTAGENLNSVGALRSKFTGTSTNSCGDGVCDADENITNCPSDCFSSCGNGTCEATLGEDETTCPSDCDLSEIDLEAGLIAHYPLNETYLTNDISGNEYHASNNGATLTTGITGQENDAYEFDGESSYLSVNSNWTSTHPFGSDNSNMSFVVWVKADNFNEDVSNHDTANNIFANSADEIDDNFELGIRNNQIDVYTELTDCNNDTTVHPSTINNVGEWYFIVVTKSDSNGLRIYKNGQQIADDLSQNCSFKVSSTQGFNLTIGKNDHIETFFDGAISDVRIYDRALSNQEILALYNLNNSCGNGICESSLGENEATCPSDCSSGEDEINLLEGLVAQYPLNAQSLTNDISGNENHGTNNGAILSSGIIGESNGAYYFDGEDDYIDFGNDSTLDISENITVSTWIKSSSESSLDLDIAVINYGYNGGASFKDGLNNLGYNYDYISTFDPLTLNQYKIVFVDFGDNNSIFFDTKLDNLDSLIEYVQNGGNLFISGDDINQYSSAEIKFKNLTGAENIENGASSNAHTINKEFYPNGSPTNLMGEAPNDGNGDDQIYSCGINCEALSSDSSVVISKKWGSNYVLAWGDGIAGTSYTSQSPMAKLFDSFIKMTSSKNIVNKGDSYGLFISGNNAYGFINGRRNMANYYIDESWNHIAYIYDKDATSANIELYINGISQNSFDINANIESTLSTLRMGESFSGSISDTRVYDRALSRPEILALYNLRNSCGNGICEAELSENEVTCVADCGAPDFDIDRGLLAYYPLDGINFTNDISDNFNHMEVTDGPVLSTGITDENEDSYSFDGVDDYMRMPGMLTFEDDHNLFTVAGWINPKKSSWIINPNSAGFDQWIGYNAGAQTLSVHIVESADTNHRSYSSRFYSVPVDRWSYFTVVIDNLNIKIYINGILEENSGEISNFAYWQNSWDVARRANDTHYYEGKMSDVRLYNRALNSSEVEQLYDEILPDENECGNGVCEAGETYLNCSTDCTSPDLSDIDLSCYDILQKGKSTGSGIYTIDPDGIGGEDPYEVYCDMETDGGGWTMIMKLKSDGQDLDYDSLYWGNDELLNETDLTLTNSSSKYKSFITLPFTQILGCMGDMNSCVSYDFSSLQGSAQTLFNSPENTTPIAPTDVEWLGLDESFGLQENCRNTGFNFEIGYYTISSRWGITSNNETTCYSSEDSVIGFGNETMPGRIGICSNFNSGNYDWNYNICRPKQGFLFVRENEVDEAVCGDSVCDFPYENETSCPVDCKIEESYELSCFDILFKDKSTGNGIYKIDPDGIGGNDPFNVYCDMTTNGGGWTLTMQTSNTSAYIYDNSVWTSTSGGSVFAGNPSVNQDYVSKAFYELEGTESMLALGNINYWNSWTHSQNTARDLSNRTRMYSTSTSYGNCLARTNCGTEPVNLKPLGIEQATSGSYSDTWHRFGYVNENNAWGPDVRVGFTGDGNSSDSSDTVMGIGLRCDGNCSSRCVTDGAHNTGSGYYFYTGWANTPLDYSAQGWLYIREFNPSSVICGDDVCNSPYEDYNNCPSDCESSIPSYCSNGIFDSSLEAATDCGLTCPDCIWPDHCLNGIKDSDETGIDCGGSCSSCGLLNHCYNDVQDYDEENLNCGGEDCDECIWPNHCTNGIYDPSLGELGTDCGGPCLDCDDDPDDPDDPINFNEITFSAKGNIISSIWPEAELWYKDMIQGWLKLDVIEINDTNFKEYTYSSENTFASLGLAVVLTNHIENRNLYIDWIQYDNESSRIESDNADLLIKDYGGILPDLWLDGVDTENASSLLDNIGALRSKNPGTIIIPEDNCGNGTCDLDENCFSCPEDCDIKPDVVESLCNTNIGFYTLSPNPYIDSESACINSNIYARFATKIDVNLLNSRVHLNKCSSDKTSCNIDIPSEISPYNEGLGFVLNPTSSLEGDVWYKVNINSISTICGKSSDPYEWYFKVSTQSCSFTNLEFSSNEYTLEDIGYTTNITASAYDDSCRNLEGSSNFNWSKLEYNSSSDPISGYNYIEIQDSSTTLPQNIITSINSSGTNYTEVKIENSGVSDTTKIWTNRIPINIPETYTDYCGDFEVKGSEECDNGYNNGFFIGESGEKCSYDCKNVYVYNNNAFNFRFYYPKSTFNFDLVSLPDKVNELDKTGDIRIIESSESTEQSARVFMDENSNPTMVLRIWTVPKENYIPITFQEWLTQKGIGGDYDFVKREGVVSDYLIYNQGNSYYFWVPNYVEGESSGDWYVNVYVLSYKEGGDLAFFNQIIDTIEFNINITSEITCDTLYDSGESSGIYTLTLKDGSRIRAYCFMSDIVGYEGGWTVVAADNLEKLGDQDETITRFPKSVDTIMNDLGVEELEIDTYIPKIFPSDEAYSYLDIWPDYTNYIGMTVYSDYYNDGSTGISTPFSAENKDIYYKIYNSYSTNDFSEVNCNMIEFVLSDDIPEGCSLDMVNNFENYFSDDIIFDDTKYSDVYEGFTWFGENEIQYYHWGTWDFMGHVLDTDVFTLGEPSEGYVGFIDEAGCDIGWGSTDCRTSKASYTERDNLDQKLILMIK